MKPRVDVQSLRNTIADVCEQQMGMPRDRVLAGTPFGVLDKHYDSLSILQIKLILEEIYDVRFDSGALLQATSLPDCLDDVVAMIAPLLIDPAGSD